MDARKVYAVCRRGLVGRGIRWGEVVGCRVVSRELDGASALRWMTGAKG